METAFWWNAHPNFGDALTPFILEVCADIKVHHTRPDFADIMVVGSILEEIPPGWSGIIAGAGKMFEQSEPELDDADIYGLRGALSAKGIAGDYVLGDPALLLDELIPAAEELHDLGVVPHWSDNDLAGRFAQYNPHVISPTQDPVRVVQEIASCKKIVSSSLHGIIVADAFRIPRRAELFAQSKREGGDFKYRDYASVIGQRIEFGKLQTPPRWKVEEVQRELHDMFECIGAAA